VAQRVGDNLHDAVDAFTRAIARAPDYAPAYSGRAFAYAIQLGWKPWQTADEAQASANADIAQALRLDTDAAEPYMVRAIMLSWRLHCDAALADYEHALKLAPGNVDVQNFFGDFLQSIGALRRAESLKRQAMALDPLAWVHPMNLNQILDSQGRYREAVAMGVRSLALGGTEFPAEQLMYSQLHAGDLDGARASLAKACAGYGEGNPSCGLDHALLLALTGNKDEARSIATRAAEQPAPEWGGVAPHVMAAAVFALGLNDYAMAAVHVTASFGAIVWYPTLALLWAQGGAKLPEEMSQDPQWLEAWNDPRAKELMALYRANVAAFRRGE
jgi:tetratricopeptide (TPR) repeat protein